MIYIMQYSYRSSSENEIDKIEYKNLVWYVRNNEISYGKKIRILQRLYPKKSTPFVYNITEKIHQLRLHEMEEGSPHLGKIVFLDTIF